MSNRPGTRLHSQLDNGVTSQESKIHGREPMRMNPLDAEQRGIRDGDVVRVFNDRGAFLAGVRLSAALRRGVVQIATGAWYDVLDLADPKSLEIHGNPNAVTNEIGTSSLGQGPSANSCLVEAERYESDYHRAAGSKFTCSHSCRSLRASVSGPPAKPEPTSPPRQCCSGEGR